LEDILFLGRSYEPLFDRFEILFALECSNKEVAKGNVAWVPPGRFAWKYRRDRLGNPFDQLVDEANEQGDNWTPVRAGLFNGSHAQFEKVAAAYKSDMQSYPMR
jgi:hypothetical protein